MMAEQSVHKVELNNVERLYVQNALKRYIESIDRARAKEVVGSEVHSLRGRELENLTGILRRF